MADRTLDILLIGAGKLLQNVLFAKDHPLYTQGLVIDAVAEGRHREGKVFHRLGCIPHGKGIIKALFLVDGKVAVGTHIRAGAPDGVVRKADLDQLHQGGAEGIALPLQAVYTGNTLEGVICLGIVIVNVAVQQGKFIPFLIAGAAKGHAVAVGRNAIGLVQHKLAEGSRFLRQTPDFVYKAGAGGIKTEQHAAKNRAILPFCHLTQFFQFHKNHLAN